MQFKDLTVTTSGCGHRTGAGMELAWPWYGPSVGAELSQCPAPINCCFPLFCQERPAETNANVDNSASPSVAQLAGRFREQAAAAKEVSQAARSAARGGGWRKGKSGSGPGRGREGGSVVITKLGREATEGPLHVRNVVATAGPGRISQQRGLHAGRGQQGQSHPPAREGGVWVPAASITH